MVVDELDTLRDEQEGCQTLAFADLSTEMILVTDTGSKLQREALNALCAQAAIMLGTKNKVLLGEQPSRSAVVATKSSVHIFLRAAGEPNDVLCCVCAPHINVDTFLSGAADCLDHISNGNA